MDDRLEPLRLDDDAHVASWVGAWNEAWPEHARSEREVRFELAMEERAQRWLVGDIGAAEVVRIRWNADDAPPIARIALAPRAPSDGAYLPVLRAAGRFARAAGFEELRVSTWDRETTYEALLDRLGFVRTEVDLQVAVQLDALGDWRRDAPAGVRITTLDAEPQLEAEAYAAYVAGGVDLPGDEPSHAPTLERWRRERSAPWVLQEACFLAVDGEERVLGFADLEQFDLEPGVAWHGFTSVRPAARGRGIAGALKSATIAWALEHGVHELRTSNDATNGPMRHINERIGFEPYATTTDWRGSIDALDDAGP